jgi:NAD(P)-dependent dehydrogenase (short-subunit alcohol dehydrogenase family)
MAMRLEGKVSLVTGASRGIGRAIALALAKEGSDLVLNSSRSVEAAESVAGEVTGRGRRALVIRADIADRSQVDDMIKKAVREFGKIDVLVNNAGISVVGASVDLDEATWRRGIDVILTGTFFCSQAAGREMMKRQGGSIISIASINGITAFPERAAYCAAKAGVMALTKVLAIEWAKSNVNVNSVAPGYVETELVRELAARGTLDIAELAARTPSGRLTKGEDVAAAVVFLASEDAKSITGQTIVVDSGWTAYGYVESWLKKEKNF